MRTGHWAFIATVWILAAGPAVAQPAAVAFNHTFDFSDGLQGWSITRNPNGQGYWVNPATEPNGPILGNGTASGAGGGNLYLPDGCTASLSLASLGLPNGTDRFVMQADVFIPNLRPLGMCTPPPGCQLGHSSNTADDAYYGQCYCDGCSSVFQYCPYVSNMNDLAGIAAVGSSTVGLIGNISNARQCLWDSSVPHSSINDAPGGLWTMEQYIDACHTSVFPYNDYPLCACWWKQWITVCLDYNWTCPGRIVAWARIPWTGPRNDPRYSTTWPWVRVLGSDDTGMADPHPGRSFTSLMLGFPYTAGLSRNSWTQSQFDNVKLALPEHYYTAELCYDGIDNDGNGAIDCRDSACIGSYYCPTKGDFDLDGDVDMVDFGHLQNCLTGTYVPQTDPACQDARLAGGTGVGGDDVEVFVQCLTGPNLPANPICGY